MTRTLSAGRAERRRHRVLHLERRLRTGPHGDLAVLELRRGRVRLHGSVGHVTVEVGLLDHGARAAARLPPGRRSVPPPTRGCGAVFCMWSKMVLSSGPAGGFSNSALILPSASTATSGRSCSTAIIPPSFTTATRRSPSPPRRCPPISASLRAPAAAEWRRAAARRSTNVAGVFGPAGDLVEAVLATRRCADHLERRYGFTGTFARCRSMRLPSTSCA